MPEGFLNIVSFILFSFFGFLTLNEGLGILQNSLGENAVVPKVLVIALVSVAFVALSVFAFAKKLKASKGSAEN